MLIKSVYDPIRAFVVAACKHLVTVVTVENQHGLSKIIPYRECVLTFGAIRLTPGRALDKLGRSSIWRIVAQSLDR